MGAKYNENRDRQFLIVDSNSDNLLMSARTYPKLVLLGNRVDGDTLVLTNTDGESININLKEVIKNGDVRTGM